MQASWPNEAWRYISLTSVPGSTVHGAETDIATLALGCRTADQGRIRHSLLSWAQGACEEQALTSTLQQLLPSTRHQDSPTQTGLSYHVLPC
uniref:Uncharacterized protein n=1 Tax=Aquila chrysaetos chrysaetos TaxID=223781 RepID=A0A663EMR7_AQUCH